MSGCRLSSAVREARIAFGNDLTGMETEGVGVVVKVCFVHAGKLPSSQ